MSRCPHAVSSLIIVAALAAVLAGCSSSRAAADVATPTPTLFPTSLPTTPPTATDATANSSCTAYTQGARGVVRSGDLLLGPIFTFPDGIFYQLPDGTPLKPLALPARNPDGSFTGWPTSTLFTNAIYVPVCNASANATHTLQGLQVKLAAFTPYSAQLSAWDFCDGVYTRQQGSQPENCDRGGAPDDLNAVATFPTDAQPGATVAATPAGVSGPVGAYPFALAIPPGRAVYVVVTVTPPTATGTYAFSASVHADGADLPFLQPAAILFAKAAHTWSGKGCQSSSMLAQIPTSNPSTQYICPAG